MLLECNMFVVLSRVINHKTFFKYHGYIIKNNKNLKIDNLFAELVILK